MLTITWWPKVSDSSLTTTTKELLFKFQWVLSKWLTTLNALCFLSETLNTLWKFAYLLHWIAIWSERSGLDYHKLDLCFPWANICPTIHKNCILGLAHKGARHKIPNQQESRIQVIYLTSSFCCQEKLRPRAKRCLAQFHMQEHDRIQTENQALWLLNKRLVINNFNYLAK